MIAETGEIPAAIDGLRAVPERARALGEAGRRLVAAERSWDAVAERRLELYESYLASGDQG